MDLPELFPSSAGAGLAPAVRLARGAGGGAAGGFGGDLLSAAAGAVGVARPDPLSEALSGVQIQLVAAPQLPSCRLRFLPRSDFPALNPGDALTVSLGNGAAPSAVFAGKVASLVGHHGALDVMLAAPAAELARLRRHEAYENQGFADLLRGWAAAASLSAGDIDRGPDYAYFAIDDRRSLWDWIARVARHADVAAWSDAQGRLHARKPRGQPVASYAYGENLLALDATSRDPVTSAARVVGEGSAGRQGSEAWAWLAKDPQGVSATAGAGPAGALESDGALRDLSAVAGAAAGLAGGAVRRADLVRVTVPGAPALDIAAVFELKDCPGGFGDGRWAAFEVRHRYTAGGGFVTELSGVPA